MRGATGARWSISGVTSYFNPRAPCGARRRYRCDCAFLIQFQSTRPMRGATQVFSVSQIDSTISIHAPHAGRDLNLWRLSALSVTNFNPRAPCGARRGYRGLAIYFTKISIHAPRAGRDNVLPLHHPAIPDFNPRAPCGRDQTHRDAPPPEQIISIHAPRAGATLDYDTIMPDSYISIHAPRAGATIVTGKTYAARKISIHAPRAGATLLRHGVDAVYAISIHAPRAGATCPNWGNG